MEIFKLFGSLFVDTAEADEALDNTDQKSTSLFGNMAIGFGKVAKGSAIAAAAVVGASAAFIGGAVKMASNTAAVADEIDKAAQRANMSAETYQKWAHTMDQTGVSTKRLEYANRNLTKQLIDVSKGNQGAIDSFAELGISMEDLENKSQEEIFEATILALADMEDETQRAALGMELLGTRAYTEMVPMLNQGSDAILELKQETYDLGLVMSNDAVQAGADLNDALDVMNKMFKSLTRSIGVALIPIITELIELIIKFLPKIQRMVAEITPIIVDMFEALIEPIIELIKNLLPPITALFMELIPVILELGAEVVPLLTDVLLALLPIFTKLVEVVLPPVIAIFFKIVQEVIPPFIAIISLITDYILPAFLTAFYTIFNHLLPIIQPVFEGITAIFETFMGVLNGVIEFLTAVFIGDWAAAWQAVVDIFGSIFFGLVELAKMPLNLIIDMINVVIDGLNRIQIPEGIPGIGGIGINIPNIPRLLVGIDDVPHDFFPAYLDKGERVLTASENRAFNEGKLSPNAGGGGANYNLNFYNVKEKSTSFETVRALQKANRLGVI